MKNCGCGCEEFDEVEVVVRIKCSHCGKVSEVSQSEWWGMRFDRIFERIEVDFEFPEIDFPEITLDFEFKDFELLCPTV